jgi:nucleotide-binding universal stress UspA family protein
MFPALGVYASRILFAVQHLQAIRLEAAPSQPLERPLEIPPGLEHANDELARIREPINAPEARYGRVMSETPDSGARPVVIGYDGSEFAKRAIQEAGRLFPGRRTVVANVFPSGADTVAAAAIGVPAAVLGEAAERLHEESRRAADQRAEEGSRLARAEGLAAEPRAEATDGSLWSALNQIADEEDALAIVVGTRGLSGFKQMLLGSTSSGLLQHASRPVVVVPQRG